MPDKPKSVFWVFVIAIVIALVGFAHYRTGLLTDDKTDTPKDSVFTAKKSIELTFFSSSAKKNWINEMVAMFNGAKHEADGRIIHVKAFHVTSGGSFDNLKKGIIKPDMWSPGSESWLEMARSHWENVKGKSLFESSAPLVNIPLVIAMWEPMAKALGYPKPIGWTDIAKVAQNPEGWAAFGYSEWGQFRWGHAHPDANSGFLTIISEVYAALQKTGGIVPSDLKDEKVISFLKSFEGTVEHYGLSNAWIDQLMHRKGPSYLSATVQYENTIIQSNIKHKNRPFKLVAIYPKEGSFRTRHPVAILDEEWMTPEKKKASEKFINFLVSETAQQQAMKMGLRPVQRSVAMSAPFDLEHGVMADIPSDKIFEVPEEGVLKRIRDLWETVKIPATIMLVLDRSGSMKGAPMDNAKIGAVEFVKNMKPRDQLIVAVFNDKSSELTQLCDIRNCGENAITRLQGVFADGGTALYDTVYKSFRNLNNMKAKEPGRRYAILLLSDGKDTGSKMDKYDFLDSLPKGENYDVPKIYTIAYGSAADNDLLAEISNSTNARVFNSSPEEIRKTYKELSANF